MYRLVLLLILSGCSVFALAQDEPSGQDGLVLTALPVTFSLTTALLADTSVGVQILPAGGRRLGGLANYFSRNADRLAETFTSATAVVTIGRLWADDPLYSSARQANIRIVEIDATRPWSNSMEGIAVALEPESTVTWANSGDDASTVSIWYWLSLANAVRSTDIIGADLKRLFPAYADTIDANQVALRSSLLSMQREFMLRLATVADITVFSLAAELIYMTSELGLYVDGRFFKQDIDWTESDLAAFEAYLRDNAISVVLHKWEPDAPIRSAIESSGARLVVLETLDAGIVEGGQMRADSYQQLTRQNLEAVLQALEF